MKLTLKFLRINNAKSNNFYPNICEDGVFLRLKLFDTLCD